MVDVKMSEMAADVSVAGTEEVLVLDGVTSKTMTIDVLSAYTIDTLVAAAEITPTTGDAVLVERSGTEGTFDIDALVSYVVGAGFDNAAMTTPTSGDLLMIEDGGTAKTITAANLATYAADFAAASLYASDSVAGLPDDADVILVFQSSTPKLLGCDTLAGYVVATIFDDASVITSALGTDSVLLDRSGEQKITLANLSTYVLSTDTSLGAKLTALSAATLGATDEYLVAQSGTAKKTTLADIETKLWADYATYVAALSDIGTVSDADVFPVLEDGSTAKYCTAAEIATYMATEIWDQTDAVAGDDADILTVFRTGTGFRNLTLPLLSAYVSAGSQATVLDISGLDAATIGTTDLVLFCQSGTGKQASVSALDTHVHAAFATYLNATLASISTLNDADFVYVVQGSTPKSCTIADIVTYTVASFPIEAADMTEGSGISTATSEICEHSVTKIGGIYKTEILIDLTSLNSGDTIADIIGKDGGTANCHLGQITADVNGTIISGRITCFETPAGGDPDVDLFSATESTGAQDALVTDLTETQLINHGDWTAGDTDVLTALPAANKYLYLACGAATDADYTAGIFLIELWGKA